MPQRLADLCTGSFGQPRPSPSSGLCLRCTPSLFTSPSLNSTPRFVRQIFSIHSLLGTMRRVFVCLVAYFKQRWEARSQAV